MSRFAAYSHGVRPPEVEYDVKGRERVIARGLEAQFEQHGPPLEHEIQEALSTFLFTGLPEDRDTEQHVSPISRLSVFDSEATAKQNGWSQEEHDLVVETLRESPQYGADFIEVGALKAKAPWNGYDKLSDPLKIAEAVELTGVNVADVIAYERENRARDEVLTLLEDLLDTVEDETSVVIEA